MGSADTRFYFSNIPALLTDSLSDLAAGEALDIELTFQVAANMSEWMSRLVYLYLRLTCTRPLTTLTSRLDVGCDGGRLGKEGDWRGDLGVTK